MGKKMETTIMALDPKLDMAHACLVVWNREDVLKDKHPHEHFPKHPPLRLHSQSPQPFTSKRLRKVYE